LGVGVVAVGVVVGCGGTVAVAVGAGVVEVGLGAVVVTVAAGVVVVAGVLAQAPRASIANTIIAMAKYNPFFTYTPPLLIEFFGLPERVSAKDSSFLIRFESTTASFLSVYFISQLVQGLKAYSSIYRQIKVIAMSIWNPAV
jgi:hypothetical protein